MLVVRTALVLLTVQLASPLRRPPHWTSTALIPSSSVSPSDEYGKATAISGDTALLGAPLEDVGDAHSVGAVYVFTRQDPGWSLRARLIPPDGKTGDQFGSALAISPSATYVLVGAKHGLLNDAGKAYIFQRDQNILASSSASDVSWSHLQTLVASNGAVGDYFGSAVAISDQYAAVSAPGHAFSAGAVYVFERRGFIWGTSHEILVSAHSARRNFFGSSLSLFRGVLAVGSPYTDLDDPRRENAGIVEIFTENQTGTANVSHPSWKPANWTRLASYLTPFLTKAKTPDGTALASDGADVGDSGASLDKFGSAVSIGDGVLLASAHYDDVSGYSNTGAVFSYKFDLKKIKTANTSLSIDALFVPTQRLTLADTTISEVQTILCAANSGSFILKLGSQRTNAISATSPLSSLKSELEALDAIDKVDVAILPEDVSPPYTVATPRWVTTYAMVNVTEEVMFSEIRNATLVSSNTTNTTMNASDSINATNATNGTNSITTTYNYTWRENVTSLQNISTTSLVQVNITQTPTAQTTVCGDPLGIDPTHPQRVSIIFTYTSYGRGNDIPPLVYVPIDLNIDSASSAPDAYLSIQTSVEAAGPQDDLLQIYDDTQFGAALSISTSGRFAAVGATHDIIGGKVNVYEMLRSNSTSETNMSGTASAAHTGLWSRVMGLNASAETTDFEGASRIPTSQAGHRFGGSISMSDEFVVVGASLADLMANFPYTINVTEELTKSHFNSTTNSTYNVTTNTTKGILQANYSSLPDRGAGFIFAIVPDPPTSVTGSVGNQKVVNLTFVEPSNENAHHILDYHVRATPLNYSVFNVAIDDENTLSGFHGHESTLKEVNSSGDGIASPKYTPSSVVHEFILNRTSGMQNVLYGLTNGQAYNVTVRARSSVGYGMYSYAMGPFIPATVPDAPLLDTSLASQILAQEAGVVSNRAISVLATLPSWNGGGIVLEMEASLVPVLGAGSFSERNGRPTLTLAQRTFNATRSFAVPGVSQTWFNFTGLVNGIGYRPRVRVRNWRGWGEYGSSYIGETPPPTSDVATIVPADFPERPILSKVVGGDENITVHFLPPAVESGAALEYELTIYQEGNRILSNDPRVWTTSSSPSVVTGLENGMSYRIAVSAFNWVGKGPRSDPPSEAVIPATTPDAVEDLSAVSGDMHIDVMWKPPKFNGGANVTSYFIWLTASDPTISLPYSQSVQASAGLHKVSFGDGGETELLNSNWVQHTVHVAAVNRVGRGVVAKHVAMPVFFGLRPWQTVLIVSSTLCMLIAIMWLWKVKKINPLSCKNIACLRGAPRGNKVAPELVVSAVGSPAPSASSQLGGGFLDTNLGIGSSSVSGDTRLHQILQGGGSISVPQQQMKSRVVKGAKRIVF